MSKEEFEKLMKAFNNQIPFEQGSKMVEEAGKYLDKCGSSPQARIALDIAIGIKKKTLKLE